MAVPKKHSTKSAKGQRRSHDALTPTQLVNGAPRRLALATKLGLVKKAK